MPLFLKQRDTEISERMDDPGCDREKLINTYRQFRTVNSLISRWRAIYTRHIRPYCTGTDRTFTLLDIGFGGGDIPRKLACWAEKDRIQLAITGIETDRRAFDYVQNLEFPDTVEFRLASSEELVARGERFDFVISNHLLHHLRREELFGVLNGAKRLSTGKVLFNDIERSDLGYVLFNLLTRPFFRNSFITEDGLASIRRSYTRRELAERLPAGWNVERLFPYRLLVYFGNDSAE